MLEDRRRNAAILAGVALVAAVVAFAWRRSGGDAPLIAVDVGHSATIGGAVSASGVSEFAFNRELAQTIGDAFARDGIAFVPVGLDGSMTDVKMRPPYAASKRATFLLSIHHDSVQPQYLETWERNGGQGLYSDRYSGFSLFVSRGNAHLAESLACARSIGAALIAAGFAPTAHHAEDIDGERRTWADERNGVYYYDNLHVLRVSAMPAVLLEAGVIVNRRDEAVLRTVETQRKIATAAGAGLRACGQVRSNPDR